jgi:hypothetical protein
MSGHLKDEPAVPALVEQLVLWQPADGESAQYEWPRTETKGLARLLAVLTNQLNPPCLLQLLLRYDQVSARLPKNSTGGLKTRVVELGQYDHLVTRSERVVKASFGGSK